jgi:hypothetical protein
MHECSPALLFGLSGLNSPSSQGRRCAAPEMECPLHGERRSARSPRLAVFVAARRWRKTESIVAASPKLWAARAFTLPRLDGGGSASSTGRNEVCFQFRSSVSSTPGTPRSSENTAKYHILAISVFLHSEAELIEPLRGK